MDLWGTLEHARMRHAQRLAVVDGDLRLSYAELHARAGALARHLEENGVDTGDRLAVLAPNSAAFLESYYAAAGLGAILVPLNTRLAAGEIARIVAHSGAKSLIASTAWRPLVERVAELEPALERVLWVGGPNTRNGRAEEGAPRYEHVVDTPGESFRPRRMPDDAIAQLYYTSGTTGEPKGVELTHGNVSAHALGTIAELQLCADDVWGHIAPMFHLADAWASFAITWVGGTHVMVPRFEEQAVLEIIAGTRITLTNLVPTMIQRLLQAPELAGTDLSSLRLMLSGGAPIAPTVVERTIAGFGCDYVQTYGLTETSPYLTFSLPAPPVRAIPPEAELRRRARTGRPFVLARVEVVDERDRPVPRDDECVGEVRARGPTVTRGYWRNERATAEALRGGWLYTGDLATVDSEGSLQIVDRKKDMIITGGEKVYSTEVENVLYRHRDVAEAAVFGVADEEWGECVRAAVVARAGAQLDVDALASFCREHLAGYKVPRRIDVLAELPKTGSGKIRKHDLRERSGRRR